MISEGGSQVFAITPDECYQIYDILVDGTSKGHNIYNYNFEDVQQNHTIQANFVIPGPIVHNADTGIDYDIIQAAIDAALDGQTIIVCPGNYTMKSASSMKTFLMITLYSLARTSTCEVATRQIPLLWLLRSSMGEEVVL